MIWVASLAAAGAVFFGTIAVFWNSLEIGVDGS